MLKSRRFVLLALASSVSLMSSLAFAEGYTVTHLIVMKKKRKLYLMHDDKVLRKYRIGLGFAPYGHKQFQGDGKTPEGSYFISYKNPNSGFHLSLKISYPNAADTAYATSQGKKPGGDIFIHGQENGKLRKRGDWTAGCLSVTNAQIREIYKYVPVGTPIHIFP
jgi:murein L,D-transpeptidase YafK